MTLAIPAIPATPAIPIPNYYASERQRLRAEQVVLVDRDDREIGIVSKLRAHREGRLHRAVSVVVLDTRGAFLLQRRAAHKYHSPGLWSNTCCGHPRPGEDALDCALRRLREEMGVECALAHAFSFVYEAALGGGMREHELDHVFVGVSDDVPHPDEQEVGAWQRMSPQQLRCELTAKPRAFTVWFRILMEQAAINQAASPRSITTSEEDVRAHSRQ